MRISEVFGRMLLVISSPAKTQVIVSWDAWHKFSKTFEPCNNTRRYVHPPFHWNELLVAKFLHLLHIFFNIYFGFQNVKSFVSHFRHFHYKLYYLLLTIDWNCYADKIICKENNIWTFEKCNTKIYFWTQVKAEKVELKNEHEFLFSLVKNNFLLMFTVAAQAVWLWGSWRSRQDASLGETRNISPLQSPRDLCPIWLLHSSTCHPVLQVNKANTR